MVKIDAKAFRTALGRFATGIVVISVCVDGVQHAMTANAFMSGSLQPPLVLVSIALRARMHDFLQRGERFGITMLSEDQEPHSRHFAGQRVDGFEPLFAELSGTPVLAAGSVRIAARLVHRYACGDHTLFIGEVEVLELDDQTNPLLFHAGKYATLGSLKEILAGTAPDQLPFFY